jgi:hypothetical protein
MSPGEKLKFYDILEPCSPEWETSTESVQYNTLSLILEDQIQTGTAYSSKDMIKIAAKVCEMSQNKLLQNKVRIALNKTDSIDHDLNDLRNLFKVLNTEEDVLTDDKNNQYKSFKSENANIRVSNTDS